MELVAGQRRDVDRRILETIFVTASMRAIVIARDLDAARTAGASSAVMTREEKVLQNGELVTEIAEQTEHLARLEAKKKKVAEVLTSFVEWLEKSPDTLISIKTPPTHFRLPDAGLPRYFDERELAGAVDLDGIFRVVDDIRKTKARLRDLHETKAKFGLQAC